MAAESLRVTADKAAGTQIALEDDFLIGRTATGEGPLAGEPELSRRHARIVQRAGDQLVIEDLGSTNGNVPELNNDLYVLGVDATSPADNGSLLFLDRIDELDGTAVENVPDVCDILGSKSPGDSMKVTGQEADGDAFTINVRLR